MLHNLSIIIDDLNRTMLGAAPSQTIPPLPFPFTRTPTPREQENTNIIIGAIICIGLLVAGTILFQALCKRGCPSPQLSKLSTIFSRSEYAEIQPLQNSEESHLIREV